jgi:hypothetical protein
MHIPRPFLAAILAIAPALTAPAGDLAPPPGPVGPTHKTLTQVEPRRILNNIPGDAQYTVQITEPGSYYLTADIIGTPNRRGIAVEADDVVIDLNGFALRGPGNLSEVGIVAIGQRTNFTIRNGTIRDWGYASLNVGGHMRHCLFEDLTIIDNIAGSLEQSEVDNSVFRNIRVKGTGEVGITAGDNCVINDCTVEGTSLGISAVFNSVISDCVTIECGTGIALFGNGIVERCSTRTSSASNSTVGIALGTGGIARNCSTVGAYIGIESNGFARIENCSVTFAVSEGIRYVQKDHITGNKVTNCPSAIRSINNIGARSTIDSNIITSCPVGIRAVSTNNIITRNIVNDGATPFDIVPGNKVGTIQTTPVGAGPWDNIAF